MITFIGGIFVGGFIGVVIMCILSVSGQTDRYEKNNEELFCIMTDKGNPKQAIKYAERRLVDLMGKSDTACVPATKVHLLVKELAKYLPDEIRVKYL